MAKDKIAKILIIDDDSGIVKSLRYCLEINNFKVTTACDGTHGIKRIKAEKPDLIILDISLPGKDGYAFIKELKDGKDVKDIPIIVISGYDAMRYPLGIDGVAAYFVKPFDPEKLIKKIRENLDQPA